MSWDWSSSRAADGQGHYQRRYPLKALNRACRDAKDKKLSLSNDLRHCANNSLGGGRTGIPAEAAMLAAGHMSYQMHPTLLHLQSQDIAKAFRIVEKCSQDVHEKILQASCE
jgi:hypothetical protein